MKCVKNRILIICLAFIAVLAASCGGAKELKEGADLNALADRLLTEISYQDKDLMPLPDQLWDRYIEQVSKDDLKQYKVIAGGGSTAEEIALFEAKDKEAAERIETGMKERYEYFRKSYANYTPEQLKNLEDPALVRNGNYVFSVFCTDNDKARDIINDWIKSVS